MRSCIRPEIALEVGVPVDVAIGAFDAFSVIAVGAVALEIVAGDGDVRIDVGCEHDGSWLVLTIHDQKGVDVVGGVEVIAGGATTMDVLRFTGDGDRLAIDVGWHRELALVLSGPCGPSLMDRLASLLVFGETSGCPGA